MLLDLVNIEKIRRVIIYFGLMLLIMFVQNILLEHITLLGTHAFIIPIVAVAFGFFEGGVFGGVFGLVMGLFCDMYFNEANVFFTVIFPIIGFSSGAASMFFVNKRFLSFFFVSFAALILTVICQMFKFIAISDSNILPVLAVAGLQTVFSLPFTLALYYPCRTISGIDLSN